MMGIWWRENKNKLVKLKALVDTVGIKSADLGDKFLFDRPFNYQLSSVHNCEDRFYSRFFNRSALIWCSESFRKCTDLHQELYITVNYIFSLLLIDFQSWKKKCKTEEK